MERRTVQTPLRAAGFVCLFVLSLLFGTGPDAGGESPPDSPGGLTAARTSYFGIDLKWTPSANMGSGVLSHYLVELFDETNGKWTRVMEAYEPSASYEASATPEISVAATPLYRSFHKGKTDHFYTIDKSEWSEAVSGNWTQEGIQAYVFGSPVPDAVPLYRSFHSEKFDHFYTTKKEEWDSAAGAGWTREKIECYVFKSEVKGAIPLYRSFHSEKFDHFYTTLLNEWSSHAANGWNQEGIEAYVFEEVVYALKPDTTYKFRVLTVTTEGTGPPAEVSIKIP